MGQILLKNILFCMEMKIYFMKKGRSMLGQILLQTLQNNRNDMGSYIVLY